MSYLSVIEQANPGKKSRVWRVGSGATFLGSIKWHRPWRKYCFFPGCDTLFDSGCLGEIRVFLDEATASRKADKFRRVGSGATFLDFYSIEAEDSKDGNV